MDTQNMEQEKGNNTITTYKTAAHTNTHTRHISFTKNYI